MAAGILSPRGAGAADAAGVAAANSAFYAALNKLFVGDVAPMREVCSHADDISYMGPNGRFEIGWANVSKDWDRQAALKLDGHVEPVEIHAVVRDDLAVVSNYEQGENTNASGKTERVRLRATNVYRLEQGKWKMIGHHTDLLPYLAK
ncbi:MAG: nuclear transport factor 2 family protein [Methylocystis sp.]|uniref:YybH family protein n=1 Tax=Methylocystis sp. TaxID=1911079 RepID=UPI003961C1ED